MKSKLIYTFILVLGTFPALAGREWSKANNPIYNGDVKTVTFNDKSYKIGNVYGLNTETRSGEDEVITTAEGTVKYYNKSTVGTFVLNNEVMQYKEDFPGVVVWGDDNTVYIQDVLSTVASGSYVKGTVSDNKIIVPADQMLDFYVEEGYGIKVGVLRTEIRVDKGEEYVDFYCEPSITEFEYLIGDNGSLTLNLPGRQFDGENPPEYVIGIYYSDEPTFLGFCDYTQKYEETDMVQITMPEGADVQPYVYIDEFNYASLVKVAYVGDKLYIQGLTHMLPEATIVANIEGDMAYVAQNEYLGIYFDQFFIVTKVLIDNPDYNEDDLHSQPYIIAPSDVRFPLTINKEAGIISAEEDGMFLCFQPDEENFDNAITLLGKFTLKYQESAAGTPANPTKLEYATKWAYSQGFNDFMFTLSNFSTEGNLLETETLYYRVFLDGEPLIFGEEVGLDLLKREVVKYAGVPDQQRFMLYGFNNGNDIYKFSDNEFDVGIYKDGLSTVGVQAMYMYDKKITYSDIVTLNIATGDITTEPAGVEEIASTPVVKREFYNISGVRINDPEKGIYIIKEIHQDGKVNFRKVKL